MTFTINHHPVTHTVELSYDQAAREQFAEAAILAEEFCKQDRAHHLLFRDIQQDLDEIAVGSALLRRLGQQTSFPFHVEAEKLRCAWNVAAFAALFRIEQGQPPAPLPSILLILAQAVPAPVRRVTLPPASKIFDRSAVSSEVWDGYELIRLWRHSGVPQLPLYHMYKLGQALYALDSPVPEIGNLLDDLTMATMSFRFTMETLARAEVAGGATKLFRNEADSATTAKFSLGATVITPNAQSRISDQEIRAAIQRHLKGDWGELVEHDRLENDQGLKVGLRLHSSYRSIDGTKFWIITEADRSVTTILLPEDY
jgi:hypothetical protein